VLVAGVVTVSLVRKRPEPSGPVARTETPPPRLVLRDPPPVETPAPAVPGVSPGPARRTPAPTPRPEPAAVVPEVGTLRIESDVPGALVFIDREYIGATPVTAENVKTGTHRLNVSMQGYDGVADTIEVAPGPRDIVVRFKEVRLDTAIDVVHKHRIGSCRGRLRATARGIRYETTNENDAFAGALTNLETLQVDYQQKVLRVKLQNGRGYDFTDPEGNADRLFVFQQQVQKVIDRLKNGDQPANP
jgi:PEGA domain